MPTDSVEVIWRHPSIRICGKRCGQPVMLNRASAKAYAAAGWCDAPVLDLGEIADQDLYDAAIAAGVVTELEEEPDVRGESEE